MGERLAARQGLVGIERSKQFRGTVIFDGRRPPMRAQRCLHDRSVCFRQERLPGGTCTHWKAPPFHGAHQKRHRRCHSITPLARPRVRPIGRLPVLWNRRRAN